IDDEEPVRFGSYSLKLNFDFTECGAVTEGACFGTSDAFPIPGSPTAIGVWVYAPEGVGIEWQGDGTQAGFWLRGYVQDGTGTNQAYDFTLEPKTVTGDQQPGIYWEGWKYLEADLTKLTGPFTIQKGMTFRLMYVAGTMMGTKTAGSLYFDNLQFVYGANIDDVDNPIINSIKCNQSELLAGSTINSNVVSFEANLQDVENKYTSGIDVNTIRMYIDGVNVAENENISYAVDPDGSKCQANDVVLVNGMHSITVSLRDNFGNETSETRYFEISSDDSTMSSLVDVSNVESTAILGESVTIEIRKNTNEEILESSTSFKFSKLFPDYDIEFSENYEGSSSYNKFTDTLKLDAIQKEETVNDDSLIAKITVKVPTSLKEGNVFSYIVSSGYYMIDDNMYTYSYPEKTIPVEAVYKIEADTVVVGQNAIICVLNNENETVEGVSIYTEAGVLVGVTDVNGQLETDMFSSSAGKYPIYAKDDQGKVSFIYNLYSYDPNGESDGTPFAIMNNAVSDPSTQQNITWMSNPLSTNLQQLQYKEKTDDEWISIDASTKILTFTKEGNTSVNVNSVTLSNLKPNSSYIYRVGYEDIWSEEYTFVTKRSNEPISMFILGDIQADDLTRINSIFNQIKTSNYDLGIQTGDAVDDATSYQDWTDITSLMGVSNLSYVDMIHVLGNHEYAGDANSTTASTIYGLPTAKAGSYYSVTYGTVYAAVINHTGTASQLNEALAWIKNDAKNSDARWKILVMHQPSYYTNITGGNAEINRLVPPVVDEVGFDFVFSGHDHTYARTEPIKDREVNEDGTVYFITGSSGEKSYSVFENPDFHFAVATQEFDGIYLDVQAGYNEIVVTTYNVKSDGTKEVFDSYTKQKDRCENDDHEYLFDEQTGNLICEKCDYIINAREAMYAGFAHEMNSGKLMYFVAGVPVTGHQYISSTHYYFDNNGYAYDGDYIIANETCQFKDGQFIGCTTADVLVAGISGVYSNFILYSDGRFILSGYGPTNNYATSGTIPWYPYRHAIKNVFIEKGITSIGVYTFRGAINCESVTFEEGSQVSNIGGSAFYYMSKLKEITLPEGVTTIGNYAFGYDTSLEKVYLPAAVSNINKTAFNNCDKSKLVLDVAEGSYAQSYAQENSIAYTTRKDEQPIGSGTCGENITWSLYADGTLELVGSGAMTNYSSNYRDVPWYEYRYSIKNIIIDKDITSIGVYAFRGAINCESVTFEEGSQVSNIG
ncbi:MAG: leucine-rich repeat protein, partial [Traorella sp.]